MKEELEIIRLRQRRLKYVLWGLVPFVLVAGYPSHPSADGEIAFIVAAIAYSVLVLAYSLRLAFTECPRCRAFFHWSWWADPWTKRCLHCGLSLKVEPDAK